MSDVTPINGAPAAAYNPAGRLRTPDRFPTAGSPRSGDKVELSRAAQYISQLIGRNDVRQDLVDRVRAEIAADKYETPEKVDAAVEELLKDL
jgi:hypothetical protein